MSSFSSLKTAIANAIKANGNQEITGNLLQGILLSIVETLGDSAINTLETGLSNEAITRGNADTDLNNLITGIKNNVDNGYVYAGIATPSTNPVSGKVFYIATKAGTYTNLGGLSVTEGITILKYNGSTWSKEQVIYGDGGVYDVTAQNGGATFASLEALLGSDSLSTLIPTAVRKGGMSIKFVQSSDNNYVQYRLMADEFTTDTEDWAIYSNSIYIDSHKFIEVKTDSEGRILWGIKKDGSIYYGAGVPQQIIDYLSGYELDDVIAFLNGLEEGDKTLQQLFDEKVDKETNKELIPVQYIQEIESPKWIKVETDNDGKVLNGIKEDGSHYAYSMHSETIDSNTKDIQYIKSYINNKEIKKIVCWGDSLTAGAGKNDLTGFDTFCQSLISKGGPNLSERTNLTYIDMLNAMLGETVIITNCGVGGETIYTIAARQGANPATFSNDIILNASKNTKTTIISGTNVGLISSYDGQANAKPIIQGQGNSVNPVFVEGIKCTLSADVSDYKASAYYINRIDDGERDITIKAGTPIIMKGSYTYTDYDIAVIWAGTNGGYNDTFLPILRNMISHLGSNKYIIVGVHTGTESSRAEYEDLLGKEFGDKYFNWRKYVSSNALYDFGFTPTADDLAAMSVGSIPPTLTTQDGLHLTAAGYGIVGYKLYERLVNLGYVKSI